MRCATGVGVTRQPPLLRHDPLTPDPDDIAAAPLSSSQCLFASGNATQCSQLTQCKGQSLGGGPIDTCVEKRCARGTHTGLRVGRAQHVGAFDLRPGYAPSQLEPQPCSSRPQPSPVTPPMLTPPPTLDPMCHLPHPAHPPPLHPLHPPPPASPPQNPGTVTSASRAAGCSARSNRPPGARTGCATSPSRPRSGSWGTTP
jgi:hypothetical protein